MKSARTRLAICLALVLGLLAAPSAFASNNGLVVSQAYGGGGNSGAPYTNDFIELFNGGTADVPLAGMSLQYASATGTGNFGATATQLTELSGVLQPGQYLLVHEAGGANGVPLPATDVVDTTPIPMAAGAGKVALVTGTSTLGCNGGSTTCDVAQLSRIVDLVGYGTGTGGANFFEGTGAAPTLSNTTAALRAGNGCQDTDVNSADFTAGTPIPRNTSSTFHSCVEDLGPSVSATSPENGATGVALTANVSVTFSEPVNVTGDWFAIVCATSGTHTATASGGPTTFTLDPASNFAANEQCTVTIRSASVSDVDDNDPPDLMEADHVFGFRTADPFVCGNPATKIHAIQGAGLASDRVGQTVQIEGVVVGDYQRTPSEFDGFYVQEEDADVDDNTATSEGIFVFRGGVDVNVGDKVRVRGNVAEFSGLTQISSITALSVCPGGGAVTPAAASLPVSNVNDHERTEGMLVRMPQELTVAEVFNLGRFGEVSLSGVGRLYSPTAVAAPGAPALAVGAQNARSRIILDDGNNQQNIDPTRYPFGGLSATNTLRVGDTVAGTLTGVMDFRFSNYRLQPVGAVSFTATNERTASPDPVGGNLKIASFNVLNYFNGDGLGGGFPTARGANTPFELERQRAKIVSALKAMNADVVGLMELENDAAPNSAIEDLVAGLNAAMGAGTYSFVDTGVIGGDAIKVALIYKPAAVTPIRDWKIITSAVDPRFDETRSRPALAQTFQHVATGERFTPVVNHLKSKSSACLPDDPDTGDGSGNCNGTRTRAAAALVDWIETDPTASGDPDFLIMGDLNAYTFETPITTVVDAGYTNLVRKYGGLKAYSYVFNGESGYLDHALATPSLEAQVTGVTDWHINPDEPVVLDYNVEFKTANQVSSFYAPGPYRASDHDPVVIGVQFTTSFETMRTLTREYVDDPLVEASLVDKLNAAQAAAARGNTAAKNGALGAYRSQVSAQAGKTITDDDARTLIRLASAL